MMFDATYEIEDHGAGCFTLSVNDSPVVKITDHHGVRACTWMVYGPADLPRSVALMKGFAHLVLLLGNEEQVLARPPENPEETGTTPTEKRKWQTSRKIPK